MTETSLQVALRQLPELSPLLSRVPNLMPRLKEVCKHEGEFTLPMGDKGIIAAVLGVAGVVEMLERLEGRFAGIEEKMATIGDQAALARAAELVWSARMPLRDSILFGNNIGEVAKIPIGFLQVYARKQQLDVSEVAGDGDEIVLMDGKTVLARIPKSLWVCLDTVLEQSAWLRGLLSGEQ